jgi:hypothetical protein
MHSNDDLSLVQHLSLVQEKPAGIWASVRAWMTRVSKLPRPAVDAMAGHGEHAAAPAEIPLYEQEFATEREALACATNAMAQGFRTVVEQSVYDYSWHVEVYPAPARNESGALAA